MKRREEATFHFLTDFTRHSLSLSLRKFMFGRREKIKEKNSEKKIRETEEEVSQKKETFVRKFEGRACRPSITLSLLPVAPHFLPFSSNSLTLSFSSFLALSSPPLSRDNVSHVLHTSFLSDGWRKR